MNEKKTSCESCQLIGMKLQSKRSAQTVDVVLLLLSLCDDVVAVETISHSTVIHLVVIETWLV